MKYFKFLTVLFSLAIKIPHLALFFFTPGDSKAAILTWRWLKESLLFFLNGLCVVVCCPFVHSKGRDLLVGLPAVIAVVWFGMSMYNMMFV